MNRWGWLLATGVGLAVACDLVVIGLNVALIRHHRQAAASRPVQPCIQGMTLHPGESCGFVVEIPIGPPARRDTSL